MQIDFKNLKISELYPKTVFEEKVLFFLKEWFSDQKTVAVQTSGSTGTPKIFDVEKEKMQNSAKMTCDFLELHEGDSALLCLPMEYISGKIMVVRAIERKLKLIIQEPSTIPLQNLENEIDFCAMTPLQVEKSLDKIHLIKNLIIGGAAVSENLKIKLTSSFQLPSSSIYETYGMSETLSHIALKEIFPKDEEFFTILDGVEISVDDRGCLQIFAPKLNSEKLQTNDLVELNTEKQFKFLARIDNVINSGGAKIFPEELESFVKKYISSEVVFVGLPDETLGQKLVLVVEGQEDERLKTTILDLDFEKSYQKPKEIFFIAKIPRTSNGKINRLQLISDLIQL